MLDGDKKFVLVTVILVCVTAVVVMVFIALWQYRETVGVTLLALLVLIVIVYLWGLVNEQSLRRARYKYKEETPLGASYPPWAQGAQPYYVPVQPGQYYTQGYPGRQQEEVKY